MATLQTKLNLEIPSNIAVQSSPSLRPYEGSAPPSPTLWAVNKSPAELTMKLKEAYSIIKERENDITLAAEIGKCLLENNIELKGKYDSAMAQLQHLEYSRAQNVTLQYQDYEDQKYRDLEYIKDLEKRNKELQQNFDDSLREFNECDSSNKSRIRRLESNLSSAIHKIEELEKENELFNKSDAEFAEGAKSLTLATEIGKSLLENNNDDNQDYKELEFVKELETQNQKLQEQLETQNQKLQEQLDEATKEYDNRDKLNKSKISKLESELNHFKEACALATLKIESLEKTKERPVQKQETDFLNSKCLKKSNENFVSLIFSSNLPVYGVPQRILFNTY